MALFLVDRGNDSIFIRLVGVRWPPLGGPSKPLAFIVLKSWGRGSPPKTLISIVSFTILRRGSDQKMVRQG